MTTLSSSPLLRLNKPKLRFSIDALMGKESEDTGTSPYRDAESPLSVKDYSISKYQHDTSDTLSPLNPQRSPVLVPIPTFPAGPSAVRARPGFLSPSAGLYQRTVPPGMETAFAGMILQGDGYQTYPWYLHRHRLLHHRFPGPDLPSYLLPPFRKTKRIRTAFSASQLMKLESAFDRNHYVTGNERKQLAESLGLTETQVKVWFQNRRTKQKRQVMEDRDRNEKNQSVPANKSLDTQHRYSSTPDTNLSPSGKSETISLCEEEDSDASYNNEERNQREINT